MFYRIHKYALILFWGCITFEFINRNGFSEFCTSINNWIKNSSDSWGWYVCLLWNSFETTGWMKSRSNKSSKPRRSLKISWKKAVAFKETFSTRTQISSFTKDKITVFHLKRKVLNGLKTIVVNSSCCQSAARTNVFFWLCFNINFYKSICVRNFFYNYIIQV